MLKSNKSLKANLKKPTKPLRARTNLKKPKPSKRIPIEKKTASQLVKIADKEYSRYIRLRDSEFDGEVFIGKCITCSKKGTVAWFDDTGKLRFTKGWDAGHFIERGIHSIRYEEENVNLQCSFHCNKMKSGNHEKYKDELDKKYGDGTYRELEKMAKLPGSRKILTKPELLQIIADSKKWVDYTLKNC